MSDNTRTETRDDHRLVILHVISGLSIGGAEMMLYKLLGATTAWASDSSVRHVVLSLGTGGELAPEIRRLGVPLVELPMPGGLPRPGFSSAFRRVVAEVDPDVVASWMYRANAVSSALVPVRIPVVWHVRQSLDHNSSQRLLFRFTRRVNRRILRSCSRRTPALVLYNSRSSRDQHAAAGFTVPDGGSLVIPNGFDMDRFSPDPDARAALRSEWGITGESEVAPIVFGIVGRHHPIKDHSGFVRAAAAADQLLLERVSESPTEPKNPANRKSSFRCVMVGRGLDENNDALRREIAAVGLSDRFLLLGERRDLPRIYTALDALVSSSLVEAFPNVLGEAMSCGVPCIATDVGDSAWIIGPTGLVVPPGDPQALGTAIADAVGWTAETRAERAHAARERVRERFALETVSGRFIAAYRGVIRPENPVSRSGFTT